ncbi:MAG: hypothetical protein NTW05_01970 [Pseudonocardiales bacterium]|nr:hypothetical protein [Pseudonocardiales bacterium]
MRLRPRSGAHRWCSGEACQEIAADVAEFLDVPVVVEERTVSQQTPPWKLPVLWWPAGRSLTPTGEEVPETLLLNAADRAVKRLLDAPADTDLVHPVRALYVTALLFGRMQPTIEQVGMLRAAVAELIDDATAGRH